MKLTFSALFCLFILAACTNSSDAEKAPSAVDAAEVETSQEQTVEAVANLATAVPTEGSLYKIITLNDTIKSPRKVMKGTINGAELSIDYGSPSVKGRTIFGDLVPYGKVWRTGANGASQITFVSDVVMGDKAVPAGTYSLFTEPTDKTNWTVIINKVADQWGAYDYDKAQDVARVPATATTVDKAVEQMDFSISEAGIELHWADLVITIPVKAAAN